jgi:IQ calmodulin-binding motif
MFMQSQYRMVRERRTFLKQRRSAMTIQSHARGKQVCNTCVLQPLHCLLSRHPPSAVTMQALCISNLTLTTPCNGGV